MAVLEIVRLRTLTDDAFALLNEYYNAIDVVVRDTREDIQHILDDPSAGVWLAMQAERSVGCVVLRQLPAIPHAGECKRLYVRPEARGLGLADALMDALESFGIASGLQWIYLDSKDDLHAAIALYRRRGYVDCARYNDNPQATVFLRKRLI